MSNALESDLSPAKFLLRVENSLRNSFTDCFSDETKKVRNLLLLISFILFLVVIGAISVGGAPIKVRQLGDLEVTVNAGLRWILIALCVYFGILLASRSYAEWQMWRFREQRPLAELRELASEIFIDHARAAKKIQGHFKRTEQLHDKLAELDKDSPEIEKLRASLDDEYKKIDDLKDQMEKTNSDWEAAAAQSIEAFWNSEEMFEKIKDRRVEHEARIAPIRIVVEEELKKAEEEFRKKSADLEARGLDARLQYIRNMYDVAFRTYKSRYWFELMFPLVFAAVAILSGIFVPLVL